jgi:predicted enzyme related to lactoylglutathione lyase
MSSRFCRYELRTTAVEAARRFYQAVLDGAAVDAITELPAPAVARGAPPHWLGHIAAGEIGGAEAAARQFAARGAERLGPQGGGMSILRDPGGAVVALTDADGPSRAHVVWHQLHANNAARTAAHYVELFGWALTERIDLATLGTHQAFAWRAGEHSVGAISDVAGRPETHTHWLFYFAVESLDAALAAVLAHGGKVLGPFDLPSGARIAACDDPHGAAFGLMETA